MPRWPWRRPSEPDPLGTGLWHRTYDDCVTAARRAPVLNDLLPRVWTMAESGQQRWPSESLDVPADDAGLRHYRRLREVQRAFREVAYRTRLAPMETGAAHVRQGDLAREAMDDAVRALNAD